MVGFVKPLQFLLLAHIVCHCHLRREDYADSMLAAIPRPQQPTYFAVYRSNEALALMMCYQNHLFVFTLGRSVILGRTAKLPFGPLLNGDQYQYVLRPLVTLLPYGRYGRYAGYIPTLASSCRVGISR